MFIANFISGFYALKPRNPQTEKLKIYNMKYIMKNLRYSSPGIVRDVSFKH